MLHLPKVPYYQQHRTPTLPLYLKPSPPEATDNKFSCAERICEPTKAEKILISERVSSDPRGLEVLPLLSNY